MRLAHDFAAVRPAAQHCRELTAHGAARGPRPEERAALMTAWRRDLSRLLAEDLSALLSGDRLEVNVPEAETLSGNAVLDRIGPVAANALLRCGLAGETALVAFDFATAIALTDRSFGGDGKPADTAPHQLPRSSALLVDEIAATVAGAITCASIGDAMSQAGAEPRGEVIIRSDSAVRLKPFAADAEVLLFPIAIANRQGCEWRCLLAIAAERMERLLPVPGSTGALPARRGPRQPASPLAAPFAAVPLPLHVVLAEVDLSLARLQALAPGDRLPLAMGRHVPLLLGDTPIAHGSIGTLEDRMAIRLTRFPAEGLAR
jgi:flagellar motor switch/type III secretory pathway protein FliN